MHLYLEVLATLGIGVAALLGYTEASMAQQDPVTAIDIALEPDSTMMQHAQDANARLLKAFPKGFSLDETHHPHVTILQRFVRTADLDKVYAAAARVLGTEQVADWKLKATKYYFISEPPLGLAGIVVEPTDDLLRLQQKLIDAVAPFTVETGSAAAFMTTSEEPDIHQSVIAYVAAFVPEHTGKKFAPHVTVGVGLITYLDKMLAEPFDAFAFSPASASVYQLGDYGAARKELKALTLKP